LDLELDPLKALNFGVDARGEYKCKMVKILNQEIEPTVHFVLYPTLRVGEFFAQKGLSFEDILESSNVHEKDKNTPLVEKSELSRLDNLSDNDIVFRMLNSSLIVNRMV
jgi:hypothetical protein